MGHSSTSLRQGHSENRLGRNRRKNGRRLIDGALVVAISSSELRQSSARGASPAPAFCHRPKLIGAISATG